MGLISSAFLNSLPFKVSTEYFMCLGINITRNPKLLFKLNFSDLIGFKYDFVMCNAFKILKQIKGVLDLPGVSTYAPICQNPYFKLGMMDAAFVQWSDKGLTAIIDLYVNDHFATFAQLQEKFGLPSSHFFRYLQVRNFVRQSIPHFETLPEQHVFYGLMTKPPHLQIFLVWQPLLSTLKKPGCRTSVMRFRMRCGLRG